MATQGHIPGYQPMVYGGYHMRVILVATQCHIPGYQPMVCGDYHLRVIQVLLSNYRELHIWLSTQDLCGGYHLGVILTLKSLYMIKNVLSLKI
jgi:hypothetical protein